MIRAERWGDMLNEVGRDLVDNGGRVAFHPFEVAAIQYFLEDRIETIMSKDDCWSDEEEDLLEIYMKLSGYVWNPNYGRKYIEERLYNVEVSPGDKIEDIIKSNLDIPNIWKRIVEACDRNHLRIDTNTGIIC